MLTFPPWMSLHSSYNCFIVVQNILNSGMTKCALSALDMIMRCSFSRLPTFVKIWVNCNQWRFRAQVFTNFVYFVKSTMSAIYLMKVAFPSIRFSINTGSPSSDAMLRSKAMAESLSIISFNLGSSRLMPCSSRAYPNKSCINRNNSPRETNPKTSYYWERMVSNLEQRSDRNFAVNIEKVVSCFFEVDDHLAFATEPRRKGILTLKGIFTIMRDSQFLVWKTSTSSINWQ